MIWALEKSDLLLKKLEDLESTLVIGSSEELEFYRRYFDLAKEFRAYLHYLTK